MLAFKEIKLNLLVGKYVASLCLDIECVTYIINFDVRAEPQVYFHRVGRTARKGLDGTAISLVSYGELSYFNNIKAITKTKIEELKSSCASEVQDSPIVGFF